MNPVKVISGDSPLILGMPHVGTFVPENVLATLNENGRQLADTDWHIEKLYDGLLPEATIVKANFHRYVIDANRDPSGQSLYPGQNTTTICPVTDFDGETIYRDGKEPGEAEIARRLGDFHTPYHAALGAEIARVKNKFGVAVLYDCHSIRSNIPFLFEGKLPDFNIGTDEGRTCSREIEQTVNEICGYPNDLSSVLNGRFKGGWTTRHYGQPAQNIHAIQMELSQCLYLESEGLPFNYSAERAQKLRPYLSQILRAISNWAHLNKRIIK